MLCFPWRQWEFMDKMSALRQVSTAQRSTACPQAPTMHALPVAEACREGLRLHAGMPTLPGTAHPPACSRLLSAKAHPRLATARPLQYYTGRLHIDQPLLQQGGINIVPTGSCFLSREAGPGW